ncbi:hypothetical protein N7G274_008159 [Stereocaulon virgatum]|uniref:NACHT domain-containing protein n=1 Tax=Stereocaulon virgatum TaxID=373712 RepID=A0ABR3ZZQ1_9LECA
MADALSVSASIITILDLTTAAIQYIRDIAHAPKECSEILTEVCANSGILSALRHNVSQARDDQTWMATIQWLSVSDGPLARFRVALECLLSRVGPTNGLRKVGRLLTWPFKKEEARDILNSIERQKSLFILALQNDNLALCRQMNSTATEVKTLVRHLQQSSLGETDLRVLEWLSPLNPQQTHLDIRSQRLPDTGLWLLDRDEFKQWRYNALSPHILWCHGIPGAGKTILASLVVDELTKTFSDTRTRLAFFYLDYRDSKAQTPANVVSSLVRQLAGQLHPLPYFVLGLYEDLKKRQTRPELEDLLPVLSKICKVSHPVYIVIDALDECAPGHSRQVIIDVIKQLEKLSVRLFLTGRPHTHCIRQELGSYPQIRVEASTSDIAKLVIETIKRSDDTMGIIDGHLRCEIVAELCSNSQGMFLLPALQVENIVNQTTRSQVRRVLREKPKKLGAALGENLSRLKQQPQSKSSLAMRVLMWLSHSRMPLSIEAVRHALAVEAGDAELDSGNLPSAKQLVEYCSGLVIIDEESGILRLSHASVQMHLYEHREDLFPSGQDDIAKICLTYLGFPGIYDTCASICSSTGWQLPLGDYAWEQLDRFPFFTYSILNWGYHARESTWEEYGPLLLRILREKPDHHLRSLMGVFGLVDRSMKTYWNSEETHWISGSRISPRSGVLHISALFGLVSIAQIFIARGEAINSRDCEGKSPIWLATLNGHEDIVRMLLHAQADPNIGDRLGRRPLQLAAASNSMSLVKLLLSAKAETKSADFQGCTPLYTAVSQGFLLVVLELLKSGASPDCITREKTALYVAAAANFPKIVRALLSARARGDVKSVMDTGSFPALGTALHVAAQKGFAKIVEMLLERADINETLVFKDNISRSRTSPLMLAASEGHERVVSVLLRYNADTEVTGVDGTALMYAIRKDRAVVVRQLLESGANPSAKDYSKNTPLIIAAKKGSLPLTQYLVTAGAALDAQDWKEQTALIHAVQAASYPIEQLLTENGASIHFRDALGKTAVEHALEMICPANGRFPCGILNELADACCNNAYDLVTDWTRLREVGWEFRTCRQGLGTSIPRRRKRQVLELCLSWMGRAIQHMWMSGSIHKIKAKAKAKDDMLSVSIGRPLGNMCYLND